MTPLIIQPPVLSCRCRPLGNVTADVDSAFWRGINPVYLVDVVSGSTPEQGTELRVAWNSQELRVLFHCVDVEPWATLTARDAPLYQEEVVEVFLDPVGDLEGYFEIEVNPLNTVLDLVLRRNRSGYVKNFAWNCDGLETQVRQATGSWAAELSVPFAAVTPELVRPGDRWRVNFCRIDRPRGRARELTAWSPTGIPLFHVPSRFGVLEFAGNCGEA